MRVQGATAVCRARVLTVCSCGGADCRGKRAFVSGERERVRIVSQCHGSPPGPCARAHVCSQCHGSQPGPRARSVFRVRVTGHERLCVSARSGPRSVPSMARDDTLPVSGTVNEVPSRLEGKRTRKIQMGGTRGGEEGSGWPKLTGGRGRSGTVCCSRPLRPWPVQSGFDSRREMDRLEVEDAAMQLIVIVHASREVAPRVPLGAATAHGASPRPLCPGVRRGVVELGEVVFPFFFLLFWDSRWYSLWPNGC